jgi:phosphatidylinositol alpha-1,6-mannosyltransferase
VTRTLLVTNDFPPKVGGIQSYLEELWRRLEPDSIVVLTASSHPDAAQFDAEALADGRRVDRVARRTLYVPSRRARRAIDDAVARARPELVLYDPYVPLGLVGPRSGVPYGVVLHGAEVAIPARLPVLRRAAVRVLEGAAVVVAAGRYPADEARRLVGERLGPVVRVPPGVDAARFHPLDPDARAAARARLGLRVDGRLVVSVGRLVPRKGIDALVGAIARLATTRDDVSVAIAGAGRDAGRLRRLAARARVDVRFLGRVAEADKAALLGAADVFAQPCRSRWGGLEQEGFGIVFLEAAACATPQVAGRSGGADEAVAAGTTGLVVDDPRDAGAVAMALASLLDDAPRRHAMGVAARERAVREFDYDVLTARLRDGLAEAIGGRAPGAS